MQLKLTRGVLVGDTWREEGEIIEASPHQAERLTRAGAAVPVSDRGIAFETAEALPRGQRAVARRQAK